ncbi:DUF726 domain-containing protein [Ophiocordyceps camponoti-floridani]|uniref:DUF726 domain-containing protein n=1 Tax=Ophiocordyceps camponoti-floridani TaxID=2030778 RepID=A0A8H4Q1N0_9HYPO|nr:DUF726 domain-containing protein [Ophiocordyceps camponoti-floridani]
MGRMGRGGGHSAFRRIDLTGLLSVAERNDLTTLVSAITDKMHNDISCIFDSPPVTPLIHQQEHHNWLSRAILNCAIADPPVDLPGDDGSKAFAKAHKTVVKEEAEAMAPQLRELKKEALLFFTKWQTAVIQRTREIQVQDTPAANTRAGRGGRGGYRGRGGRGGAVRNGRGGLTLATGPPQISPAATDPELATRFSPTPNTLWSLPFDKRKLLLHLVMLLVLSLQDYGANARILVLNLASSLNLTFEIYHENELRISRALAKAALEFSSNQQPDQKPDVKINSRRWKNCLAAGSPANAGLAGRLKADGVGTMQHGPGLPPAAVAGLLGPMADHAHLLSNLFGISPVRPVSKMIDSCCRDIQDFALVRLLDDGQHSEYRVAGETPAADRRLHVAVVMSGCLSQNRDVTEPWQCLGRETETYVVKWEVDALVHMGASFETVTKSLAWKTAKKDIAARFDSSNLLNFSWPSQLLKISKIIDIPWSMGMVRAEKVGALLADAIIRHKFQGERSVSLVGYGLAARAIYTCLMVLAERRQFGLVDSVVMMGAPAPSESRVWLTLKSVVSGRLVNVYSKHDYLLAFLYRTSNLHFGIAGLHEIQGAYGVENHCVGQLPRGHDDYHSLTGRILRDIAWEGVEVKAEPLSALKPVRNTRSHRRNPARRPKAAR